MRKITFLFSVYVCMFSCVAGAANFQVKKASAVKQQEAASGLESITSGSLVSGVMGLVSGVSALNKQQKDLEAECVPTSQELEWVNKMVKEYAKSGGQITMDVCEDGVKYAEEVEVNKSVGQDPSCVADAYHESGAIWDGYPIADKAQYCAGGGDNCASSKKKTVSNIYAIFDAISFSEEDYTADEATMYTKFVAKMEKCAPEKIAARKKEAYAGFVKGTIAGVGQKSNTGGIMDAVGGLTQGGGGLGGIQSLAPSVVQFLGQ